MRDDVVEGEGVRVIDEDALGVLVLVPVRLPDPVDELDPVEVVVGVEEEEDVLEGVRVGVSEGDEEGVGVTDEDELEVGVLEREEVALVLGELVRVLVGVSEEE